MSQNKASRSNHTIVWCEFAQIFSPEPKPPPPFLNLSMLLCSPGSSPCHTRLSLHTPLYFPRGSNMNWVMCHVWMSHFTLESRHICECVFWLSHVTHMTASSVSTCEWVMPHMQMRHLPHLSQPYHACEWAVPHTNESCPTYERVTSHVWTSHVTRMNESCHTYKSPRQYYCHMCTPPHSLYQESMWGEIVGNRQRLVEHATFASASGLSI